MNTCPLTYEACGNSLYSVKGLKLLAQSLEKLELFPFTAEEQRAEALARATKLSIQGAQPKISAVLNIKESRFDLVDKGGKFILKPQHQFYPQLPENEDVTMRMAKAAGIKVPIHGMIWSKDNTLTYLIKRFDRKGLTEKIPVEDFAQLAMLSRETKYNYSMEKLVQLMDKFCTFPLIEKSKLFRLVLFNFLTGNEDMHLKNYSLIRYGEKIELSPAYDLLNTTIVLKGGAEEIALTLAGKKRKLSRKVLIDYFGKQTCGLTEKVIDNSLQSLFQAKNRWFDLLTICFLSPELKTKYITLLENRLKVLDL
ncbi:MAG: HipA domain-containing protein [Bacteroidales bacterium]